MLECKKMWMRELCVDRLHRLGFPDAAAVLAGVHGI